MPKKEPEKTAQLAQIIDPGTFALAEYAALRSELLKQSDYQHQAIQLAFIAAGTFFSLNARAGMQPILLLAYPILALFLSLGWASSAIRSKRIHLYISENIENKVAGGGWESFLHTKTSAIKRSMSVFYARGAFIGTQLVAILLALPQLSFTNLEILFLFADLVAILAVIYLTRPNRPAFL
jgi:hypothetical protein